MWQDILDTSWKRMILVATLATFGVPTMHKDEFNFCLNNCLISIFPFLPSFLCRELFIFFYVKPSKITVSSAVRYHSIVFSWVNNSNNEEVLIFLSLRKVKETEA